MDGMELICFQIISAVGSARSNYIEAINEAKIGNYDKAASLIDEGRIMFNEGHKFHGKLLTQDAEGQHPEFSLILMHAEDLMLSAEAFGILAEEFIDVYKILDKKLASGK